MKTGPLWQTKISPRVLLLISTVMTLALWLVVTLYPVSNRLTRAAGLLLRAFLWGQLLLVVWRQRMVRSLFVIFTLLVGSLFLLPGRSYDVSDLRKDYQAGLERYRGVTYIWGGESPLGIDCSGLIRRGLIDALFWRGLRTADGGLLRQAVALWWNDCTANDLRQARWTVPLLETPNLNQLEDARLWPGDLAITRNGLHILAYQGERTWIEAEPSAGRVISVTAPVLDDPWLESPMEIVRWKVLMLPR